MRHHYVLVEGVNISVNIFDTDQLSVIRGGSFLLKGAIKHVASNFTDQLEAISTGASSGLFVVRKNADVDLVRNGVVDLLRGNKKFSVLTFVVESCEADSLQAAREQLLAQLRFRQLQSATLVPDTLGGLSPGPTDWGGIRPVDEVAETITYYGPVGKTVTISNSEKTRWLYGRDKKQNYYMEELIDLDLEEGEQNNYRELRDKLGEYCFTRELGEIAKSPLNDQSEPMYPGLDGKIALFYADGNDFGTIQRQTLQKTDREQQDESQRQFDRSMRTNRGRFLARVLADMLSDNSKIFPHIKTTSRDDNGKERDALRFETLLWGGDEMLLVMPAWIGFEFIQFFFAETAKWDTIDNQALTHSAGLVFCNAKTPIRITRQLAQVIVDNIKARTRKRGKTNSWDYMVLESIDYPTHHDFPKFLHEHYGAVAEQRPLFIPPAENWIDNRKIVKDLLDQYLPTRQLYQIAHLLTRHTPEQSFSGANNPGVGWPPDDSSSNVISPLEGMEIRMLQVSDVKSELVEAVAAAGESFGLNIKDQRERAWVWLHLLVLRDYISPRRVES